MRSSRQKDPSQKSLTAQAWDGLLVFFFKTVIPLIPIAAIFYAAAMMLNAEVNGIYDGSVADVGAVRIIMNEDHDRLNGLMILGTKERYKIIDGKMLDDNKFQMLLEKDNGAAILGLDSIDTAPNSKSVITTTLPSESAVPENISSTPDGMGDSRAALAQVSVEGSASQGTINAKMSIDGKVIPFHAHRNGFQSFLGWRWFNRLLRYFGIKN